MKKTLSIALMSAAAFGLAACDVEKKQSGNVDLPKYEVEKKQAGDVKLPEYDVKTPDVAVNKEQRTVDVPTIKKEERTVTVPDVDVKPAQEK
ncbi:hypothetical protein [Noviherbaspirillum sp.]|uniref:hypothetical protein n=1 Tax=Noviherbaspirillum sp. TaxID=1926288 RepID=UPI002D415B16|nr:hypothetical protein [Noviherbaspirillum sp.]HZW20142.1 hypothetical protein [Noviherbaspirillum sp.]